MRIKEINETGKKYKIYADKLEQGAIDQFTSTMQQENVIRGALMADAHTGYTVPIGCVVAVKDAIYPAFVGYDIGCSVASVKTTFKKQDIVNNREAIFNQIYRDVPTGYNHNKDDTIWHEYSSLQKSEWLEETFKKNGLKQLGTLGSGNHFIEIGYDEQDNVWISVHSGSRNIGHNVGSRYMALASGTENPKEGYFSLHTKSVEAQKYWMDMNFCLAFAQANREEILCRVDNAIFRYIKAGEVLWNTMINHNHNHVELCLNTGLWIHRKGAVEAYEGQYGVVAGTMQDGLFIVRGKGNPESLCSCSHGAGRIMGRNEASKKLNMEEFSKGMEGITASVCQETLDEAKGAYKDIFEVMECQKDLVEIVAHVKPIINIKHKEKKRK